MVTNAGVLRDAVLWKMTDEDFDLVIQTHLRGTFTCARAAAIAMREQGEGGRIIVVGSPAGQRGNFGQTNYAAAKAGIAAFARTWAMELRARGDHRQRDRPDGLDGDDREQSRSTRRWPSASTRGEPLPRGGAPGACRSACPRTARRWSCSWPRTRRRRSPARRSGSAATAHAVVASRGGTCRAARGRLERRGDRRRLARSPGRRLAQPSGISLPELWSSA